MSLDDDIMMPCSDLERGFATWRKAPQKMVGFYPRLIEGTPLEFRGERWVPQVQWAVTRQCRHCHVCV